jgi:uncharacterized protein YbgA (DUF1722 family)/uncharacterized protein YbbK (DUF523 family)
MKDSISNQPATTPETPQLGLSSCLAGERVRYNGDHSNHSYINNTLGKFFTFHHFCPEVAIGLGVPREPIRLVSIKSPETDQKQIHCVGVKDPTNDVTDRLNNIAKQQFYWVNDLHGYITKKDSPSCGMERVKVFQGTAKGAMPEKKGSGLYISAIMKQFPLLPVEEEGRLGDPVLRENFIERVYIYYRWKNLVKSGITAHKLLDFHSRHKFNLLSHDQEIYRELGRFISGVTDDSVQKIADEYINTLMMAMRKKATRGNHVNVMQHLTGFLKNSLEPFEKEELTQLFTTYSQGDIPRIVPLTLLNHFFRKYPNAYINESYYLTPYPDEMRILNAT